MSAPSQKIAPQIVTLVKRTRFNPIRNLSPDILAQQLDSFAVGYLRDFALTADAIKRRDDVISVALPKREKSVSRRSWAAQIIEGLDDRQKSVALEHQKALQYFYDNLTATHALDQNQRGGMRLLVRQMMEAVGFRYAVHEIVWEPRIDEATGQNRLTATFYFVPLWFFENTTGKLRFLRNYLGNIHGEEMEPNEWLVTVGEGIMEPLAVAYMYKRLSLQDWVTFSEKFGMPGILGKTPAQQDSPEWDALAQAVEEFSADWSAIVNQGADLTLVEAKGGGGSLPFPPLVERMDRAIATICRGADLSTISAGSGQGQGASVQGEESDILEEDDAAMISETLDSISRFVIKQLFGTDTPLAYLRIVVPQKATTDDTIKRVAFLRDSGVAVSQAYVRQELGVPAPQQGEAVITRPASPLQPQISLLNSAMKDVRASQFRKAALKQLSQAQAEALKPLADRIEQVLGIEDPAAQDAAMTKLQADMPKIYRQIMADPALRDAFEKIFGTALLGGAVEGAEERALKS